MDCPRCGSSHTIGRGKSATGAAHRKCQDCGRDFVTDATKQRPLQGYSSAAEAGMAEAWATGSAPTEALWMYRAMRASGATPDEIRKDIDVSEAELARLEMLIRHHALSPFRVERMLEFRRAVLRSFNKLVEQENRQAANVPVVPALPQERGPQLTLCINPRWR